jgi:hypothetical protein
MIPAAAGITVFSEKLSAVEEYQNAHKNGGKEIGDPVKDRSKAFHNTFLLIKIPVYGYIILPTRAVVKCRGAEGSF